MPSLFIFINECGVSIFLKDCKYLHCKLTAVCLRSAKPLDTLHRDSNSRVSHSLVQSVSLLLT